MENSGAASFMKYDYDELLDRKFKVIADETRQAIIILLRERLLNAGEIASHFRYSMASISYHLRKLEQSGIVSSMRSGQYIQYRLNKAALDEICLWLEGLLLNKQEGDDMGKY